MAIQLKDINLLHRGKNIRLVFIHKNDILSLYFYFVDGGSVNFIPTTRLSDQKKKKTVSYGFAYCGNFVLGCTAEGVGCTLDYLFSNITSRVVCVFVRLDLF